MMLHVLHSLAQVKEKTEDYPVQVKEQAEASPDQVKEQAEEGVESLDSRIPSSKVDKDRVAFEKDLLVQVEKREAAINEYWTEELIRQTKVCAGNPFCNFA
jgi:hypothetical protein